MDTILWTGPADQRINMVFLSDGYQAAQLDRFLDDVHSVTDHFFSQSPFKEYRPYFNLVAINVPSEESGAKKNPSDTLNNYFGSSFNNSGIDRLLVAGKSYLAQEILFNQFPFFHQAVLIVNDAKYGGSGGWLATTSVHESAPEIALHEIGHSFAGLADEYWAGDQFARETSNLTQETDRNQIRWKNWLNFNEVDIYPHNESPTWLRPHQNCKMRVLNPDFCPVCREALVKQIHRLVNPIIHFEPEDEGLVLSEDSITFRVELLHPQPSSLSSQWKINQELVSSSNEWVAHRAEIDQKLNTVDLIIADTTHFVRDIVHEQNNIHSLSWFVELGETTSNRQPTLKQLVIVYPNPTSRDLFIMQTAQPYHGSIRLELRDVSGKLLYQDVLLDHARSIEFASYPSGTYFLKFQDESGVMMSRILKL